MAFTLADLGWKETLSVFGNKNHILEDVLVESPFILAPESASLRSSIDVKTEACADFLNFPSKCHDVLTLLGWIFKLNLSNCAKKIYLDSRLGKNGMPYRVVSSSRRRRGFQHWYRLLLVQLL